MNRHLVAALVAASAWVVSVPGKAAAAEHASGWIGEKGTASYYSSKYQGRRASDGSRFDQKRLTAAHAWLPLGTKVRVTLAGTTHSVVVTITDRLYSHRRVVDLSLAAAKALGIVSRGVAQVELDPAG